MTKHSGNISKMQTELIDSQVHYSLPIGNISMDMNSLIGNPITITFQNRINCIVCGKKTQKSFAQGLCYTCLTTAPQAEDCVLKPELCQAHLGIARDMEYAREHCLCDQIVYMAISSGLKVGVTRHHQVPTRWIDQGASFALPIARVPNRYTAGMIEVALKDNFSDKTDWRKMLKNEVDTTSNLITERERAKSIVAPEYQQYFLTDTAITQINYPVIEFPTKIKSYDLEKNITISSILKGIKGQYLLFEDSTVMNIRKYGGYFVDVEF